MEQVRLNINKRSNIIIIRKPRLNISSIELDK